MRRCRITRLGKTVGQMQNLQQLSLAGNQITELPPAIGNLTHLKMLQVCVRHCIIQNPY